LNIYIYRAAWLFLALSFSSGVATAQFESEPVSRVLDNTEYQFFAEFYRENRDDFTRGGSSLELIAPPPGFGFPQPGGFVSGDKTVTFDYKFDPKATGERFTFHIFSSLEAIPIINELAPTDEVWCQGSFYLPTGSESFNLLSEKTDTSDSVLLIDNMRITSGRNVESRQCFEPTDRASSAAILPVLSLLLEGESASRSPGSFRGTLSLPNGQVAPSGGVSFDISTFPAEFAFVDGEFLSTITEVTIPQGQNSANYEIELFEESPDSDQKSLDFECVRGCTGLDITTNGSWSESLGVTDFFFGTPYSHFANNTVNITLEAADTFTGTISLPDGFLSTGNEFIVVSIGEEGLLLGSRYSTFVRTMPNENGWSYQLGVPTNSVAPNWSVRVSCLSCGPNISTETQFTTTVMGDPLTEIEVNRFLFTPNTDYSDVNMTLIEVQ